MTAHDAGGAMFSSRRTPRDATAASDPTGFDTALAQSGADASTDLTGALVTSDLALSTSTLVKTALAAPVAATSASSTDSLSTPAFQLGAGDLGVETSKGLAAAPTFAGLGAGDRLASQMTAARLDAATTGSSVSSLGADQSVWKTAEGANVATVAQTATTSARHWHGDAMTNATAATPSVVVPVLPIAAKTPMAPYRAAATPTGSATATPAFTSASVATAKGAAQTKQSCAVDKLASAATAAPDSAAAPAATVAPQTTAALIPALPEPSAALIAQTLATSPAVAASVASSALTASTASKINLSDAVARIGAALSAPIMAPVASKKTESAPVAEDSDKTMPVHVVSQQSWLPPVETLRTGGDRSSAGETVGRNSEKTAEAKAPDAAPQTAPEALSPVSLVETAQAAALPSARSSSVAGTPSHPNAMPGASQPRDSVSLPTPTVRRDLEITLTQQDLGDLSVKMKSAGDRLELSFVSDRGETARMISDKSSALESQLNGAGLGLGGVTISSAAAGGANANANANADSNAGGGAGQGASSGGAFSGASGGQTQANADTTQQRQSGRPRQDERHEPGDTIRDSARTAGDRGLYL
jgi:hypothetical protein